MIASDHMKIHCTEVLQVNIWSSLGLYLQRRYDHATIANMILLWGSIWTVFLCILAWPARAKAFSQLLYDHIIKPYMTYMWCKCNESRYWISKNIGIFDNLSHSDLYLSLSVDNSPTGGWSGLHWNACGQLHISVDTRPACIWGGLLMCRYLQVHLHVSSVVIGHHMYCKLIYTWSARALHADHRAAELTVVCLVQAVACWSVECVGSTTKLTLPRALSFPSFLHWQIHVTVWTNTYCNLDKYILYLGQMNFAVIHVHHKKVVATGIPFALILCLLLIYPQATSLPHKILLISHLTSTVECSIPHTNWR